MMHSIDVSAAVTCCVFGIGLRDVLALDVQALELAVERRLEHVRDAQARLVLQRHAPGVLELRAHLVVGDVAVARELVRERAHVAGALHVVLAAQRIHADALAADVAGRHGEVRDAHDHGRALAVLGHAETVVDRAVAARWRRGARRRAPRLAGTPVIASIASGEFALERDEVAPLLEGVDLAARAHEVLLDQSLGHDHVRERVDQRHVGAGPQLQVIAAAAMCGVRTRSMRRGSATISFAPWRRRRFICEANTGWPSVGIRADHENHVRLHHRVEVLRARRLAERVLEAVARGRMADARAGVDVVVAEAGAHELLHEVGFLVRAARGGDAADGVAAVLGLDALEFGWRRRRSPPPSSPRATDR